jgi:AcrR family transcriptional regulator
VTTPDPRESRRAREIERTRQDIQVAAARVFARGGFHAATMQAIAREAGFTAASLYTYFESKDAIYDELCTEVLQAMMATFDVPVPAGLSFVQRLELLLQRQMALVAERLDALRMIFDVGPPHSRERTATAEILLRLEKFLGEAGRRELRCSPRDAALLLFGLERVMVMGWVDGEAVPDPVRLSSRLVDLFLHGAGRAAQPF